MSRRIFRATVASVVLGGIMACSQAAARDGADPPATRRPSPRGPAAVGARPARRGSVTDVVARVLPSVVSISSTRIAREVPPLLPFEAPFFRRFFGPELQSRPQEQGLGSGVVVAPDLILTNQHVIEGAAEIRVSTSEKRELETKLVGVDPKSDLAVLRVIGATLPPIAWGDSSRLRLGETVLAMGNPFGFGETVTMGIVSAQGRIGVGKPGDEDIIQTDAAINPANSGGPLVNLRGELVGINTAVVSRSGGTAAAGFAIPANSARAVLDSLVRHGKVVRGWLGVKTQDLTPELARAMKVPDTSGAVVSAVPPDSPGAKSGLVRGDVIVKVGSDHVDSASQLHRLISRAAAGAKLTLEVRREGTVKALTVVLGEAPSSGPAVSSAAPPERGTAFPLGGLTLDALSPSLRAKYHLSNQVSSGVLVTAVERGSQASAAALRPGDVVLEINRKAVTSVDQFKAEWDRSHDAALLLVQRGEATLFVPMHRG